MSREGLHLWALPQWSGHLPLPGELHQKVPILSNIYFLLCFLLNFKKNPECVEPLLRLTAEARELYLPFDNDTSRCDKGRRSGQRRLSWPRAESPSVKPAYSKVAASWELVRNCQMPAAEYRSPLTYRRLYKPLKKFNDPSLICCLYWSSAGHCWLILRQEMSNNWNEHVKVNRSTVTPSCAPQPAAAARFLPWWQQVMETTRCLTLQVRWMRRRVPCRVPAESSAVPPLRSPGTPPQEAVVLLVGRRRRLLPAVPRHLRTHKRASAGKDGTLDRAPVSMTED